MLQTETCTVIKNGNSTNSSPGFGSGNSGGGGNDIKYPPNCSASKFSTSIQGLGFGASADSTIGPDELDKMYSPKRNKKIIKIVTVLGYIFSVSTVAIVLSLYYLFLWDPYSKGMKTTTTTTQQPMSALFQFPGEPELSTMINNFEDETATKYYAMSQDNLHHRLPRDLSQDNLHDGLPRDLSSRENPFTAISKAQTDGKTRGHIPN